MLWAVTAQAKMPFDVDPVIPTTETAGLYVLVKTPGDTPLAVPYAAVINASGIEKAAVYMTHYATCPDGARYRRRRAAA